MSSIGAMKRQMIEDRRMAAPHYSAVPKDNPQTEFIRKRLRKEIGEDIGFQCYPDKKNSNSHRSNPKKGDATPKVNSFAGEVLASMHENDEEDDKMEKKEQKIHRTAWKGPKLDNPFKVQDLDSVISTFKEPGIVFDGGATPIGRKSDSNLFEWVEEFCRLEHKKIKLEEERAFI